MAGARLDPATTAIRIAWTGTLRGRSAALIELKPAGGGGLYYGYYGDKVTSEPGTATPIDPDPKGFATLQVPVGEKVSVRAYGAANRLLGETALPDLEENRGEIPGSTRSTRLVD